MTVLTVPSSMRTFRGLCFFLYSMVSCNVSGVCVCVSMAPVQHMRAMQAPTCRGRGRKKTRNGMQGALEGGPARKEGEAGPPPRNVPHCGACSSPEPSQPPARSLSWGLHPTKTSQSRWLEESSGSSDLLAAGLTTAQAGREACPTCTPMQSRATSPGDLDRRADRQAPRASARPRREGSQQSLGLAGSTAQDRQAAAAGLPQAARWPHCRLQASALQHPQEE